MNKEFYFEFENKFRGSREIISDRLSMYDQLLDRIFKKNISHKAIDIGCGRGEWLQKMQNRVSECIGIESDKEMVEKCNQLGLDVIHGDAIDILSTFSKSSVDVITIFHVIEHLDRHQIHRLINRCQHVLKDNGVLLIETPSIDSILVSTNTFYLDPTHINHINPDYISFFLERNGFNKVKHYFINGGPLQRDNSMKITRILNGVAQDLFILATNSKEMTNILFTNSEEWESELALAPTTLQCAIEYDDELKKFLEKQDKIRLRLEEQNMILKNDLYNLRKELKYSLIFSRNIAKFLKRIKSVLRPIKKYILYITNKSFNTLANIYILRQIILSTKFRYLLKIIFEKLLKEKLITKTQIDSKFYQFSYKQEEYNKFNKFNKRLTLLYNHSSRSKELSKLLIESKNQSINQ